MGGRIDKIQKEVGLAGRCWCFFPPSSSEISMFSSVFLSAITRKGNKQRKKKKKKVSKIIDIKVLEREGTLSGE